jgi:uncharacterized protein (DUF1800 family)
MLQYLDNNRNRRGKPNENLARELMELFSLGPENYTEQDVREGARALTGWTAARGRFVKARRQHDNGVKSILGDRGAFDGDDFVDIILRQPACAAFMATAFWRFFAGTEAPAPVLARLARRFRESEYDVKTLLAALFTSPEFYDAGVVGQQIKSPVELVVGTLRLLSIQMQAPELMLGSLGLMGQVPGMPPNVKGWPGGRRWINASTLLNRFTFVDLVLGGAPAAEMKMARRMMKMRTTDSAALTPDWGVAFGALPEDTAAAVDAVAQTLLATAPSATDRAAIVEAAGRRRQEEGAAALQYVVRTLCLSPAYQLC